MLQVRTTGEATVEVGVPDGWGPVGVDKEQMDHALAVMESSLGKAGCDVVVLRRRNAHLSGHSLDTAGARRVSVCIILPGSVIQAQRMA
jgi:GTPase